MGNLAEAIDDRTVAARNMDFEPLPRGRYKAIVTASEVVPTSAGDGLRLMLTHTVFEEGFEGRLIFTSLNIKNPSEKAQQIGQGMLSSLSKACGFDGIPEDSADLHDKLHIISVKIKQGDIKDVNTGERYNDKNEITGFYKQDGSSVRKPKEASDGKKSTSGDVDDLPF